MQAHSRMERIGLILVADDEPIVIRVVCLALRNAGHKLTASSTGPEEACEKAGKMTHLDVLIVGYRPHHGRPTAERILLIHPQAKVLHISGFPREHLESQGHLTPGAAYLSKPFTHQHIQHAVDKLLAA